VSIVAQASVHHLTGLASLKLCGAAAVLAPNQAMYELPPHLVAANLTQVLCNLHPVVQQTLHGSRPATERDGKV